MRPLLYHKLDDNDDVNCDEHGDDDHDNDDHDDAEVILMSGVMVWW